MPGNFMRLGIDGQRTRLAVTPYSCQNSMRLGPTDGSYFEPAPGLNVFAGVKLTM
jgi:hypothetical protein